jgi:hypothetical protein
MSTKRLFKVLIALALMVSVGVAAFAALAQDTAPGVEVLRFDVAEDMTRFVMDEAPVFEEDGLAAHGNAFVTAGYIYPEGTLVDGNGVLADGSPEFPDLVLGEWMCRGWFINDGAHQTEGAWVVTTQFFGFGETPGAATLVTDGIEIADVGVPVARAITGGTGPYSAARGQANQIFQGFNASEGVNLSFEVVIES